ncbi:hypothetical protein F4779DRAFT_632823 [Xylariaceae sp. FL0662B]|nr:hypothetical protein F4779DRAFT_632823 [Xylariaceae sp. FL0662B]
MTTLPGGLKNPKLLELPLPATTYNCIPLVYDNSREAAKHQAARTYLQYLIDTSGLSTVLSVHLIHRRFNLPENHVMVYTSLKGNSCPNFILGSPCNPEKVESPRGLHFMAGPKGKGNMLAYEYTTEPGVDLSGQENFVAVFAAAVIGLGVETIFGLTAKPVCEPHSHLAEFKMDDHISAILFSEMALPTQTMNSFGADQVSTSSPVKRRVSDDEAGLRSVFTDEPCIEDIFGSNIYHDNHPLRNGTPCTDGRATLPGGSRFYCS